MRPDAFAGMSYVGRSSNECSSEMLPLWKRQNSSLSRNRPLVRFRNLKVITLVAGGMLSRSQNPAGASPSLGGALASCAPEASGGVPASPPGAIASMPCAVPSARDPASPGESDPDPQALTSSAVEAHAAASAPERGKDRVGMRGSPLG